MNKCILVLFILICSTQFTLAQINNFVPPIYYFQVDSTHLETEFRCQDRQCDPAEKLGYFSTYIVDKKGVKATGWVLVKKKDYLIARQVVYGKQSGFELEYQRTKDSYVLKFVKIYSKDLFQNPLFEMVFDPAKMKDTLDIISALKRYKIYHQNPEDPSSIATKIKILSATKQKETAYSYYKESNSTHKFTRKYERNDTLLHCQLDMYSITSIPKLIPLDQVENVLQGFW